MLSELPFSTPLAWVVALVPAALRWWWGRTLAGLADDPAFPERLAAHRLRTSRSFGIFVGLLVALFTDTLLWSAPLLVLSCTFASFQLRRTVFRETWGFGRYLSFVGRAIVAIFGFWILLIALPALAGASGSYDWLVASGLGLFLFAWNARYSECVRFLLQTKAIDNPPLIVKFVALAQASTAGGLPIFEQIPVRGGSIVNAFAFPSLRRSAVLFTESLLARLDDDEIVAICGHELAHVEHYNRDRLRRLNRVTLLLIAGAVVAAALGHFAHSWMASPAIVWPVVVVGTMAWRVRDRQKHETESDLRAVELTGDPEALARALIKIHAAAHLPRRWDAEFEQRCSHPSLARRIKAIRAATPGPTVATPTDATSTTVVSSDGRIQVTFGDRQLEWRESDVSSHSLSYAHLTELRVRALSPTLMRLHIVNRSGQQWSIPIADSDIARVQAALDRVDGQFADALPAPGPWPMLQRAFTLFAVCFAVLGGQIATMLVALLALFRPAAPLAAAAGAALIAGAALALRQPDWTSLDLQPWVSLGLTALGGTLLWSAWKTRDGASQTLVNRLVAGIAILGALTFVAVLSEGADLIRVHQAARGLPAAVVLPLACAAALTCYRHWGARVGAATAIIVGLSMATVGAVPFLDRFGSDPLLLPSQEIARVAVGGRPSAEFPLPFYVNDVRLSPGGVYLSSHDMRDHQYGDRRPRAIHVGRLGGALTPVVADDLLFVDDERVLTLDEDDEGVRVEERALGQLDAVVWRRRVPGLFDAALSVDRPSGSWRLLGWDGDGRIVRVRGKIGEENIDVTRWTSPIDEPSWLTTAGASGNHVLVVDTNYEMNEPRGMMLAHILTMLKPGAMVSHLWHVAEDGGKDLGTSVLVSECVAGAFGDERIVCSGHDGTRTRIVALDPATGAFTAVGVMTGRFTTDRHSPPGWLTGWCDITPCALRLATRELLTVTERQHAILGFTANDRWLGTIAADGTRATLRLFDLPK